MSFKLLKTERCAEEMRSVSKGRFGCAEPDWCTSIRDALGCVRIGKIALAAATICAASSALATDLEDFYLRHDFSSGARETSYGPNSSATKDIGSAAATAVYGPDGADTAVHPGSAWGEAFGNNDASSLLNSDWSVAASVRAAPVEGGVIFSLGRLNTEDGVKAVALCSSSTNGKLYLKVLKRDGNGRSVEADAEATVADTDTQNGFHAVVLVYKATAAGQGTFTLYLDGAQVATVAATSSMPFGNSFQYASLLSTGASDAAKLGCVSVAGGNTALAFQDMRVFTSALTAEDAAAYAALYPTTLPAFTKNLDQYAYVQSYGVNAIDTGYLAKTDTVFAVDFEYTAIEAQRRIFGCYSSYNKTSGVSNDGLTSGLYINGSGQFAFAKFSTYASGGTWMTFAGQVPGDTERHIFSTEDKSTDKTIGTLSLNDRSGAKDGTTTANHGTDATKPIYLFANNKAGTVQYQSKAKIYSFAASEGAANPAIFLAPAEENGAAGFRDIVSGAFYGDIVDSPSQALTYQSGIGQASDYRYRSGKFYARIYAVSADASKGLVKFEGGEAAGTNAQFTARGRTAKISAVLPSGGTPTVVQWSGDTWAITEGTVNDATITVKSDTAIRLVATIVPMPEWMNKDGTGSLDSAENWTRTPGSGEDAVLVLSGDTAITCAEAKTFGKLTIKGAYSADFSGAETVVLSSVTLNGVTNLVTGGKMQFPAINIPSGCTVTITGAEGLADGGLTGTGTLVVDPGTDNTFTMSKENNSFTGEAVVKSGVVRLGNATSFGPLNRANSIRVKGGATLDEGDAASQAYNKEKNKVILEEGASFVYSGENTDPKTHAITTLTLEGNATVDTSVKDVAIGQHYNYDYSHINLDANTLTVTGGKTFYISVCTISGTGTVDIQEGTTVVSTHAYKTAGCNTTCANGTIHIRNGAAWRLQTYLPGDAVNLSTKNLILDGQIVRDENTYNLTVTGSITGNGTTPVLAMGTGAVFKPTGTGYLTITESLSGTMTIDLSGLELPAGSIPLFKVGSAAMLPVENEIAFAAGFDTKGLRLRKTRDGLGYDLAHTGFTILIR